MNALHSVVAWSWLAAILLLTGCAPSPRSILDATAKAYRQARTYSDDARVRMSFIRGDATTARTIPFRVVFARPDRIRIECYDARVVADGTTLFATVGGVPGQIRTDEVKSPLTLDQIIADDQVLAALAEGEAGLPTQLALLLADDTVDLILAEASAPPHVVGIEEVDGHPCTRVDVRKPDGMLSLWIDRRSHLLRRLSLPTDAYARLVSEQSGTVTGVSVVVDFTAATVDAPIPDTAFTLSVPEGAARVARLEPPPASTTSGIGGFDTRPPRVIAPRQQPVRFTLVDAWRTETVAMPGNVVCFAASAADATTRIAVLDGWRTVAVLDPSGKEVSRHELTLPRDAAIGFLRTAVDADGRRWWLGGAQSAQQVFVFDSDWTLAAAFPPPGGPAHAGISDAHLVDGDGDGRPEVVVAFSGDRGLEWATLDGVRRWPDRTTPPAVSVAALPVGDGRMGLAAVTAGGQVVTIAADGTVGTPLGVTRGDGDEAVLPLRQIFGGPVAMDNAWALVAIATTAGKNTAVGLRLDGSAAWRLPLAGGTHHDGPIEPVAGADLLGSKRWQWLLAEPDGSVTFAWADGGVVDRYSHGRPLVGLGGYRADGAGHVVLATPDGVECLRLDDIALD